MAASASHGVEAREERDRAAGEQRREHRAEDAERMGERQRRQGNVVFGQVHHRHAPGIERPGHRRLGQQHAFRVAGAARGVEHDGGIAGVRLDGGEGRLVLADGLDQAVRREIVEDAFALAGGEPRIERQHGSAGLQPAEQRDDQRGPGLRGRARRGCRARRPATPGTRPPSLPCPRSAASRQVPRPKAAPACRAVSGPRLPAAARGERPSRITAAAPPRRCRPTLPTGSCAGG